MKRRKPYVWIVWLAVLAIIVAAIWLIMHNNGKLETSADHEELTSFWRIWVITGLPALMLLLLPKQKALPHPLLSMPLKKLKVQTILLCISGLLFFTAMLTTPVRSVLDYFYLYKVIFLLIIPLIIIKIFSTRYRSQWYIRPWQWLYPMLVTLLWAYMYFVSPIALTSNVNYEMELMYVVIGAAISFLLNSVLEEFFYRVWLQTRLEVLLGTWPAICVTAMLWSLWHTAIQGGESLDLAISNVLVYQGVLGLFLGFLWAKYRNIWSLILIHGFMNFPLQIIIQLFGE